MKREEVLLVGLPELQARIDKLERDLARARGERDDALRATRSKTEFLAGMSHDIRTPLNAVIGMLHLALKTSLDARQRDYLAKAQSSAQHLLRLVDDLLDLSKAESGRVELDAADFELQRVLRSVADMQSSRCAAKQIELVFDVAADVPSRVTGDPLRIGQMLAHCTNHAIKYSEAGAVTVRVGVDALDEDAATLRFAVIDQGVGMTPERSAQLQAVLASGDPALAEGGVSIGLALVGRLARQMGGAAGAGSADDGRGAVWFTARVGTCHAPVEHAALPELRGHRALVVDDSDSGRAVLVGRLRDMLLSVYEVPTPEAAVQALRMAAQFGEGFDLVYVDGDLPGSMGLVRAVAAMGLEHPPALVMQTSEAVPDQGVRHVLPKPVSASTLFETTIAALAQRGGDAPAPATPPASRLEPLRGARILLVEDNEINQRIACELLEDAGIVVDVAPNGRIGVGMAREGDYDLVLMDVQMPVMDGITATREIRHIERLSQLPIVAMTANAMQRDRENCLAAGMDDFVAKPIDPAELETVLLRRVASR